MQRLNAPGWTVTLGLAVVALGAGMLAPVVRTAPVEAEQVTADGAWDPCVRVGRMECCLRPEEGRGTTPP